MSSAVPTEAFGDFLDAVPFEYLADDWDEPTRYTIVDKEADDISTHWITAEESYAVPWEEWR